MNNLTGISLFERTAIKIKPREMTGRAHKIQALVCAKEAVLSPGQSFLVIRNDL